MDIAVSTFTAADTEAAERAYEIESLCTAADLPDFPPVCRQSFFAGLSHPWPGRKLHRALAHLDGAPVGLVRTLLPDLDNTDNAYLEIFVPPQHRRKGVGRALFEHSVRLARAQGRKRIFGDSVAALPAGPARTEAGRGFALAMGAKSALVDVRRRLDIAGLDEVALDRLLAEAQTRADGYSLVRWSGPTPQEYVADVAYLEGRLFEDAPMGDLEWEPEKVDVARIRGIEAARKARGQRSYHVGMRHDASGRLAAWTMLTLNATVPWHAFQQITLVEPRHRGHRLGAIVKIENLRYAMAHEPELRVIDTWNAAVNDHMVSINEAMGFRPVDGWDNWQLTL
ncbi:MAG TPA: GNAT family N-acetyltransferase [Micromonosporaceae bacterium]|nr:GNAT family N-acetyltransferase [Micromonosporaceae bacterium]